jgi:DNA-binding NarL/FixJ family response regulator
MSRPGTAQQYWDGRFSALRGPPPEAIAAVRRRSGPLKERSAVPTTRITTHIPAPANPRVVAATVPAARSTPSAAAFLTASSAGLSASPGRGPLRDGAPLRPVPVAVLAGDPLTGQGAVAHLRARPEVRILGAERQQEAEVVLIVVDRVTEETLKLMERVAEESVNQDARFVLVGDGVREHHMLRAVTCGLVSVIPRREADYDRIVRAIVDIREGKLEMPGLALGWLVGQLRAIHQDVLEPNGLTAAGLETREVDVLGLLSEGLSTFEIAQRLNYSERTVKNIIHGVLTRLKLRNRTHAVAFAVRTGAL